MVGHVRRMQIDGMIRNANWKKKMRRQRKTTMNRSYNDHKECSVTDSSLEVERQNMQNSSSWQTLSINSKLLQGGSG